MINLPLIIGAIVLTLTMSGIAYWLGWAWARIVWQSISDKSNWNTTYPGAGLTTGIVFLPLVLTFVLFRDLVATLVITTIVALAHYVGFRRTLSQLAQQPYIKKKRKP